MLACLILGLQGITGCSSGIPHGRTDPGLDGSEGRAAPRDPSAAIEQRFYSDLRAAIRRVIAVSHGAEITPIEHPSQGDFTWSYLSPNQIFNQRTFDYISARVSPGDAPGTARLSAAGGFPNAYLQVISGIAYTLSRADQATIEGALRGAHRNAQSVVTIYQAIFGEITGEAMAEAQSATGPLPIATKIDYVIGYAMGHRWSGRQQEKRPPLTCMEMSAARDLYALLPYMPPAGLPVTLAASVYLNQIAPASALQSKLQLGNWIIRQMVNNTSRPSAENGGMYTVAPQTGAVSEAPQVGYTISVSLASIQNDLENKQRRIRVEVVVPRGHAGGVLRFSRERTFDHDMHSVTGAGRESSLTVEYQGYAVVPVAPAAWQQATSTGWFYADPIAEAYKNDDQDVSGFKFVGRPEYNLKPLAEGGSFGRLAGLLISSYPTITIRYKNADYGSFQKAWQGAARGDVDLFSTKLGAGSDGRYTSDVQRGPSNEEFSVTFTPSLEIASVPTMEKTGYVIGGLFEFPATDAARGQASALKGERRYDTSRRGRPTARPAGPIKEAR